MQHDFLRSFLSETFTQVGDSTGFGAMSQKFSIKLSDLASLQHDMNNNDLVVTLEVPSNGPVWTKMNNQIKVHCSLYTMGLAQCTPSQSDWHMHNGLWTLLKADKKGDRISWNTNTSLTLASLIMNTHSCAPFGKTTLNQIAEEDENC